MEYRKRVATVYLLGFFIDLANLFVGNVAFPDIARDFRCGVTELAWVGTAYILGLTVVIPLGGWLAGGALGRQARFHVFLAAVHAGVDRRRLRALAG